ncbi:MAG: peroxidase [Acidobacteria bacterium]|nr:peroxidase [Acidobacteriota bacterium]
MSKPAWIRTVAEEDADPALAELYEEVRDPVSGKLDHVLQVHSLHPAGLRAHQDLYSAVMRGTPTLRGAEREMIAVVVSQLNACHY